MLKYKGGDLQMVPTVFYQIQVFKIKLKPKENTQ